MSEEPPAQAGPEQPRPEAQPQTVPPPAAAPGQPAQPSPVQPGQPPAASQQPGAFMAPVQPPAGWWPPGYGDPAFLGPPRPQVRWVNPQRRLHVAAVAVAIAVVCGGAGVAIGWAASDHHDGGPGRVRMLQPGYYGQMLPGQGKLGPRQLPGGAPVPTPSGTATS